MVDFQKPAAQDWSVERQSEFMANTLLTRGRSEDTNRRSQALTQPPIACRRKSSGGD